MKKSILVIVLLASCQGEKSHIEAATGGQSSLRSEGGRSPSNSSIMPGKKLGKGGSRSSSSAGGQGGTVSSSTPPSPGGTTQQGGTTSSSREEEDRFGVRKLYPTVAGGREWFLSDSAHVADEEWIPDELGTVSKTSELGVFHSDGNGAEAEVRLSVHSPLGKAWWQNVEMTMYTRKTSSIGGCLEHWELAARCEHHGADERSFLLLNDGNLAPEGTPTWPWYRSMTSGDTYKENCVGSSYHGNVYRETGRVLFEKEISHIEGYSGPQGSVFLSNWDGSREHWFGYKFVLRNYRSNSERVHLELWMDVEANGTWVKSSEFDDQAATWFAETSTLDGCSLPPYNYASDQVLFWAGPWALFRSDCMGIDFKWLSVREIAPLS